MVYCSQVGMVFKKDLYKAIKKEIALVYLADPEDAEEIENIFNCSTKVESKEDILFHLDYQKFYYDLKGTPEYKLMEIIDNLTCFNEESGFDRDDVYILIMGQEMGDINEIGSYCNNPFNLRIIQSMVFDEEDGVL